MRTCLVWFIFRKINGYRLFYLVAENGMEEQSKVMEIVFEDASCP